MAKSKLKITEFTNPSGGSAWRLSGTLNGQRIRENFKSRQNAVSKRQKYDIERLNSASKGQTVWTTLTHDQNRDAISAVNRLKQSGSTKTLDFAVNYMLEHYREAAEELGVPDAVAEYLEEKSKEETRGIISRRQYKSILSEMKTLKLVFSKRVIGEISSEEIDAYLKGLPPGAREAVSLKTWNNRRGYLSTFFKFCLAKKYVVENPVLEIIQFKIKKSRSTAETLDAAEAQEFMLWLESYRGNEPNKRGKWWGVPGCMVPYFALTLFAGIRPDWKDGEISKLKPRDIRMDTGVIFIEPEVSKVNEKRSINIQPNLKLWLEKYPLSKFPIMPEKCFETMWSHIRRTHELSHDVLRHTYISMTVGAFRSVGDASLQAGNSETVIRKHYLELKSVEEADQFWQIVPKGESLSVFEKNDGRYITSVS
ncbi:MAG: tyrosine-type recombinase/integrase [Opitutaceae bacterium]